MGGHRYALHPQSLNRKRILPVHKRGILLWSIQSRIVHNRPIRLPLLDITGLESPNEAYPMHHRIPVVRKHRERVLRWYSLCISPMLDLPNLRFFSLDKCALENVRTLALESSASLFAVRKIFPRCKQSSSTRMPACGQVSFHCVHFLS